MQNTAKHLLIIFSSIFLWQVNTFSAHAWFKICNRIGVNSFHRGGSPDAPTLDVSFKYLDINDNRANSYHRYNNGWITKRYKIRAATCVEVYPHELWRRNKYYYVYVQGRTKGFEQVDIGKSQNFNHDVY